MKNTIFFALIMIISFSSLANINYYAAEKTNEVAYEETTSVPVHPPV
ncbi:hypothetical protein [Paenisporosarcina sp. TG-14]|nr:hypothetical protein [Paenisporosarcina sp. TG-14]